MKDNYIIVLFKNKKKRKIIKRFVTETRAKKHFIKLCNENDKIIFDKKIENATDSDYYLGLITNKTKIQKTINMVDDLGRNLIVNLNDDSHVFLDIKKYKIEEKIFDWQNQKRISYNQFLKDYFSDFRLKNVFTLNNKICVQIDEDVSVFSLKDDSESKRLLYILENKFMDEFRTDCIFVSDISSAQRKWIYDIMESKGFDKKRLYRTKTTFSKR